MKIVICGSMTAAKEMVAIENRSSLFVVGLVNNALVRSGVVNDF